jgi:hypothetical protein
VPVHTITLLQPMTSPLSAAMSVAMLNDMLIQCRTESETNNGVTPFAAEHNIGYCPLADLEILLFRKVLLHVFFIQRARYLSSRSL